MSEKTKENQRRRLSCFVVALRKVSLEWFPSGDCLCEGAVITISVMSIIVVSCLAPKT